LTGSRWTRTAAACAAVALGLGSPLWGAPSPSAPPVISVTADIMDVDAVARVVTATGRVRIADGVTTATAQRATLYQREGRGVLSGGARVVAPTGVLEASVVTITYVGRVITRIAARGSASLKSRTVAVAAGAVTMTLAEELVTAEEAVRITSPPDIVATGARLWYHRAREAATLEGGARLQNRDGIIGGERIESTGRWARATVTGSVWSRFRDIEIRSRAAEYDRAEQKAIFAGDVQISQPGRVLVTERATVWYGSGRIVAEGATRVRLETPP